MIEEKVKIFKALSDPSRLRILKMLQGKKLCVCEIREILGLANSTVSQHLSLLKFSGFIIEEKDGKWVNYYLNPHPSDPAVASVLSLLPFWLDGDTLIESDEKRTNKVDRKIICCR